MDQQDHSAVYYNDYTVYGLICLINSEEKLPGNWIGEQCRMLIPMSSPAESQTLLSH